jgi:hypothetical protein
MNTTPLRHVDGTEEELHYSRSWYKVEANGQHHKLYVFKIILTRKTSATTDFFQQTP